MQSVSVLTHCLFLLGLVALPAHAQSQQTNTPPTPGTVLDSVQERRQPQLSTPAEVFFPRNVPSPARAEGRRFLVSGFTFTGNTVFPEALLRRLVERHLDFELSLADLDRVADSVTTFYRMQGFTVARAFIPPQRVEDGLVTIQVIEGRVESVVFKGVPKSQERFFDAFVSPLVSSPGVPGVVVTDAALERRMLLLNDLPGVKARATLAPGSKFGTTDIEVAVDQTPLAINAGTNNFARSDMGPNRVEAGLQWNGPLRRGDQLGLRLIRSTNQLFRYASLSYSTPVGSDGVRVAVSATRSEYELGGNFAVLGIAGRIRSVDATVSYPVVRTRSRNMIAALQVRNTNTKQSALGTLLSQSDLPIATASLYSNWVAQDSSSTSLNVALSSNFGKNTRNAVSEPDKVAAKLDADLTYLTGATRNWDLYIRGRGVISAQALPDTEKLSIGGPDSVRAFQSSEIRGDSGYLATIELRRQFSAAGFPGYAAMFIDTGGVATRGFLGSDRRSGIGVGLSYYLGKYGQFKLEYAHPLENSVNASGKKGRTWVSLNLAY